MLARGGSSAAESGRIRRTRKRKKKKKKKKKDNDNDDPAPPSQLYTVDGEHFFQSRVELDRHLSGKYRKAKPAADSRKRKEERVAKKKAAIEAARAAALDLAHLAIANTTNVASGSSLPPLSPSPSKQIQRSIRSPRPQALAIQTKTWG